MMRAVLAAIAVTIPIAAAAEPLHFYNGRLFIHARVNDVPTEALLDSAAEASLVDLLFAARAKLPEGTTQEIRGSGGKAKARIVEGVTIEAVGQTLHPEVVVVTDLSDLSKRLIKRRTEVVVGRELFDAERLRIDIAGGQIEALDRKAAPVGRRLPLNSQHGVEAIPVTVNGTKVKAEFDLGNGSGILISRDLANRLRLKSIGREAGGGIGGEVERDLVRLASLEIAGVNMQNLTAAIDDQSNASELNVGTSVLKHFLITTDYKDRAVWLASR
jgi:aspartyl protease